MPESSPTPTLVWFRSDLRLRDNPALVAAARRGGPVVPVFVWSPDEEAPWAPGGASRLWLHLSLAALDDGLRARGSRLVLRAAPSSGAALDELVGETGAGAVLWNRRYEPACVGRDRAIEERLRGRGIHAASTNAALLREPWEVSTRSGGPFQVFTPFFRAWTEQGTPPPPLPAPARLGAPARWPRSLPLRALALLPTVDWTQGIRAAWTPGEEGARRQLARFVRGALAGYAQRRDFPGQSAGSRLSPHLHFGEIGPRQIWHALEGLGAAGGAGGAAFRRELAWREFAHHVLHHFPHTTTRPLRPEFARFPWAKAPQHLRAWQRGRTGYPIVDAGMRELWTTGFMHNRVRMIAASFLVKHLLQDWRAGARWFWDTLVDADLANNTLNWQWVAGSGADAAPFFRVFNPVLQGEKFDADGAYVARWVPELARLPAAYIHQPWAAPAAVLAEAGVRLGRDYPEPLVEHGPARARALAAFAEIRAAGR
jgi:deoxyribodipyrimidine photo-lyase